MRSLDPEELAMVSTVSRYVLISVLAASTAVLSAVSPVTSHAQGKSRGMHRSSIRAASVATATGTLSVSPSTVVVGTTATVQGAGFTPQSRVFAFWRRPDGTRRGVFVRTTGSGTFAFSLGFAPRHGIGTELVAASDRATGRTTSVVSVAVVARGIGPGLLMATMNPVHIGGVTVIIGRAFTPRSVVVVQWRRPDGSMAALRVLTNTAGAFAFQLLADPRHGCGTRPFTALDLATLLANGPGPFLLAETC
jgi:hypothetical protein